MQLRTINSSKKEVRNGYPWYARPDSTAWGDRVKAVTLPGNFQFGVLRSKTRVAELWCAAEKFSMRLAVTVSTGPPPSGETGAKGCEPRRKPT
jgi:hypothetical protein